MNTNNCFYFKLEQLSPEIRIQNNLKPDTKNRLDCTFFNAPESHLRGLTFFVNHKGMFYLNLTPAQKVSKASLQRQAVYMLTGRSVNLTSIFIDDPESPEYAYGNPPYKPMLTKKKKPNPMFSFKEDLYLFIINDDYTQVELVIVPGQKNLWTSYYLKLIQGELNSAIQNLRDGAKPFYHYGL